MWNLLSDSDENILHFIINGIDPLIAELFLKKNTSSCIDFTSAWYCSQ